MTKFRIKHQDTANNCEKTHTEHAAVANGCIVILELLQDDQKIIEEGLERLSREGGEKKCMHDLIEKEFRMGKWEPSDTHDCSELCEDKSHKAEDEKCKCGCIGHDGPCCIASPQPPQGKEKWVDDIDALLVYMVSVALSKEKADSLKVKTERAEEFNKAGIRIKFFIRELLEKTREEALRESGWLL